MTWEEEVSALQIQINQLTQLNAALLEKQAKHDHRVGELLSYNGFLTGKVREYRRLIGVCGRHKFNLPLYINGLNELYDYATKELMDKPPLYEMPTK